MLWPGFLLFLFNRWGILLVLWAYIFFKLFFAGKKASISTDDHKVDDNDNFDEFLEGMFPWLTAAVFRRLVICQHWQHDSKMPKFQNKMNLGVSQFQTFLYPLNSIKPLSVYPLGTEINMWPREANRMYNIFSFQLWGKGWQRTIIKLHVVTIIGLQRKWRMSFAGCLW